MFPTGLHSLLFYFSNLFDFRNLMREYTHAKFWWELTINMSSIFNQQFNQFWRTDPAGFGEYFLAFRTGPVNGNSIIKCVLNVLKHSTQNGNLVESVCSFNLVCTQWNLCFTTAEFYAHLTFVAGNSGTNRTFSLEVNLYLRPQ